MTHRLDESKIEMWSFFGDSTLKWQMIKKVWVDPDIAMRFYSGGGYTTIPTTQIPDAALEFLEAPPQADKKSMVDRRR